MSAVSPLIRSKCCAGIKCLVSGNRTLEIDYTPNSGFGPVIRERSSGSLKTDFSRSIENR